MISVILAAGQGTRLRPLTDNLPKTLIEVKGQPILNWIFEALPEEIDRVIIVRGYHGKLIEQQYKNHHLNRVIKYIDQPQLDGTAGALWTVRKHLPQKEKFLLLHGDNLYGTKDLKNLVHNQTLTMGVFKDIRPTLKIILEVNSTQRLLGAHYPQELELKRENFICTGAYLLDQQIFQIDPVIIENNEKGLPQTLVQLAQIIPIQTQEFTSWTEINSLKDLDAARLL